MIAQDNHHVSMTAEDNDAVQTATGDVHDFDAIPQDNDFSVTAGVNDNVYITAGYEQNFAAIVEDADNI